MSNFIVGKHYIEILTVLQTESKNIGQLAESEKKRLHRSQSLVCVGYDLNYRCQINSELLIKLLKPTNFS